MNVKTLVTGERQRLEADGYTVYKEDHRDKESLLVMFRDAGPEDLGGKFKIMIFDADVERLGDMFSIYVFVNLARQKVDMFAVGEDTDDNI